MPNLLLERFLPELQSAKALVKYAEWRKNQPGEARKWDEYVQAIGAYTGGTRPVPPALGTHFGKMLVSVGELQVSVTDIGSSYPGTTPVTFTTNITDGQELTLPFTWTASVTPAPDSVQFWADGALLLQDSASPFSHTITNMSAGSHVLGLCAWHGTTRTCYDPLGTGLGFATITIPSSSTGILRDTFTDFYTQWGFSSADHNGQIFLNRWNRGVGTGLQTMLTTQTPWPSTGGAAIYEINDHLGRPGFRFVCNPEMQDQTSKKVEIYESNGEGGDVNPYGISMIRGLGYTDEISFVVRFPASGNPSGFPGPAQGVYDRRNVFWQHSMDGANKLHLFGISRLGYSNRFYLAIYRDSALSTEALGVTLPWEVELDKDYAFRHKITWANNATGRFEWWVQRESDPAEVQYANYTGQTYGSTPNTEFGFYSARYLNNEVVISDIRVTAH